MAGGEGRAADRTPAVEERSEDGSDDVSTAELAVMVAALGFTVALFSVATWHAIAGGAAASPRATVAPADVDGGGRYTATLHNPGDVGLVSATVAVDCGDSPREVTFEHVPADSRRTAAVSCPPDADPSAEVWTWVPD